MRTSTRAVAGWAAIRAASTASRVPSVKAGGSAYSTSSPVSPVRPWVLEPTTSRRPPWCTARPAASAPAQ
ncbi:hypothetical protein [Streptomyces sp. WAC05292]|uniref:hypothetical protein n=1 Tax=Streptomyces sp. WAC05292 TaxID=2487418 RepID=UPI000F7396F4|nr:hypothetical protein [Streptomyces sp. WAC05292]